jgi:hypothetical protein
MNKGEKVMTELLKLLLSLPIAMVLIIIGALMACALAFEEYFGFKPLKKTRWMTGVLGLFILALGVASAIFVPTKPVKSTPPQPVTKIETKMPQKPDVIAEAKSSPSTQISKQPSPKQTTEVYPPQSMKGQNICEKYKNHTAQSWDKEFLHETQEGTWHVFVASLDTGQTAEDAEKLVDQYRKRFPNHDFKSMPTVNNKQNKNFRYAIIIAEGLTNSNIAKEIARYARECGIAKDAFAYQQTF